MSVVTPPPSSSNKPRDPLRDSVAKDSGRFTPWRSVSDASTSTGAFGPTCPRSRYREENDESGNPRSRGFIIDLIAFTEQSLFC